LRTERNRSEKTNQKKGKKKRENRKVTETERNGKNTEQIKKTRATKEKKKNNEDKVKKSDKEIYDMVREFIVRVILSSKTMNANMLKKYLEKYFYLGDEEEGVYEEDDDEG